MIEAAERTILWVRTYRLGASQPVVFVLQFLHGCIEVVEVFVPEERIIRNMPLSTGIVKGVSIPLSREVKPLQELG